MKTKKIKCEICEKEEIVEKFVKRFICGDCDKKEELQKQLNQMSVKGLMNYGNKTKTPILP